MYACVCFFFADMCCNTSFFFLSFFLKNKYNHLSAKVGGITITDGGITLSAKLPGALAAELAGLTTGVTAGYVLSVASFLKKGMEAGV